MRPAPPPATSVLLPACFPRALVLNLILSLPRPEPRHAALDPCRIATVLEMVRDLAPRDPVEAMLVGNIVASHLQVLEVFAQAAAQEQRDMAVMMQWQRLGLALSRVAERTHQRLDRYRKDHRNAPPQAEPRRHDVAELMAIWRRDAHVEVPPEPAAAPAARPAASGNVVPWPNSPIDRTRLH